MQLFCIKAGYVIRSSVCKAVMLLAVETRNLAILTLQFDDVTVKTIYSYVRVSLGDNSSL